VRGAIEIKTVAKENSSAIAIIIIISIIIIIMSQGTYLESSIDHIATLPHEVRRNLELMKDMDKSCS
jgi:hypothetical protein